MTTSREFISGFLELYRLHPSLWKVDSPEYTNKHMKNKSYRDLVEFCRSFYADADKAFVQHKIQNLRTTFRKEMRKVEDSMKNAAGPEDFYVPKLWYFDLLLFIKDDVLAQQYHGTRELLSNTDTRVQNDTAKTKHTDITENNVEEDSDDYEYETSESAEFVDLGNSVNSNQQETENFDCTPASSEPLKSFKLPETPKKVSIQKRNFDKEKDIVKTCLQVIKQITVPNKFNDVRSNLDEFDALAITWAAKMRKLDDDQKIFAEDLINRVLNRAYFKELTRSSLLTDGDRDSV